MASRIPSEEEILGWTESFKNWGRWGEDDELGTLNLITAEKRRQAAGLVREGLTVSCARPIAYDYTPEYPPGTAPPRHFMLSSGERADATASMDAFLIAPHGFTMTHLDALGHIFRAGRMYNGRPAQVVTTSEGATFGSVEAAGGGVISRGVLLDIAALKGVDWLEPGTPIHIDDLEAAEERQGVRVEPGDILFVRTGYLNLLVTRGPVAPPGVTSGLHGSCLPFLRDRGVAVLGGDTANDVRPSGYAAISSPIHQIGIVAMGLWLIDNCALEELAAVCARLGRWTYLLTFAPLKLKYGTGCPVNPIALF